MFDNTIMKENTKKLYQHVSVSKPKKFGNQNTNSINVIVNPNDADDDEQEAGMPLSKIAQLNALNKQGMSPMEMNHIQQEALRKDEPIDGQTINESNQELNDASRMMNEDMMARQRDLEEERQIERENAREHMIEMKGLEDEMARMTAVMKTHLAEEEVEEGFNTPQNQLTPPPPEQYTSALMETFEQLKREITPEVRKRLPIKVKRGQGKKAQYDKTSTDDFLNREK